MMIPMLTKLLAITKEADKVLGSSSRLTILFHGLSCFVLRILMSFPVNEKNAILDPETIKDITSRNKIRTTKMVVACALMISSIGFRLTESEILFKGLSKISGFRY